MADNKTATLTVLGGPLAGTQSELPESGTLTIGSSPDSSLYLDLPAVSPYHARIVIDAGRITAHDTGSSRTVHVNDNAIGPEGTELHNGDIVWLGAPGDDDVVMMQCILPRPAAAPTPPGIGSTGATPTPEIETVALWATESPKGMASALADAATARWPRSRVRRAGPGSGRGHARALGVRRRLPGPATSDARGRAELVSCQRPGR
jgi:pSer/pThr/pTyr-binding forkhead associated (FHA) protein